jgi:hypothetical protein
MKILQKIGVFLLINIIIGCAGQGKEQTSEEILKDKQKREEIMATISGDNEMLGEMMSYMMKNDSAVQMMRSHDGMMHKMMVNNPMMMENMLGMMEKDSTMCTMMGNLMMQNSHMMKMMQNMGKTGSMKNGKMMSEGGAATICLQHKGLMKSE